jgi:hypothetical protein
MSLSDPALRLVLYEGADAQPLASEDRFEMIRSLLERGYAVTRRSNATFDVAVDATPTIVLARFDDGQPPAVAAKDTALRFQDIGGVDHTRIGELVETAGPLSARRDTANGNRGFPSSIMIAARTACSASASASLVFTESTPKSASRCKTRTTAKRIVRVFACLSGGAIMFPKYKAGPINGDVVSDADMQREKMKVDISALLGGDIYAMLRLRSEKARSRFSKERDSDKALAERQKCLVKLASAGDIPPEVLMSLPSPEEIARRAEEAALKAQAARAEAGHTV